MYIRTRRMAGCSAWCGSRLDTRPRGAWDGCSHPGARDICTPGAGGGGKTMLERGDAVYCVTSSRIPPAIREAGLHCAAPPYDTPFPSRNGELKANFDLCRLEASCLLEFYSCSPAPFRALPQSDVPGAYVPLGRAFAFPRLSTACGVILRSCTGTGPAGINRGYGGSVAIHFFLHPSHAADRRPQTADLETPPATH